MNPAQQVPSLCVETLYGEHHRWLHNWLRRKLNGADEAADLAHDTFVRVLSANRASTVEALREPRAYLTTIARRLLINHVRHKALENAWLDAVALLPEPEAPSTEQRLLILEALRRIDAMLDGLAPKVREAFLRVQLDGWSHARVAEALGVTERSVRRYLTQALTQCILLVDA